ncbi:hypothetical protein GIB67_021948 [Kingdonia uniflora]|uniref:Uncharacterized protein n=1 Tax=Kingdonia uniflora TaxID=39325 RepID=A0A7J7P8G0_9MAGN|nr:hypothetical protein GIB67_021948 [Kingdonia uniflora]
MLVAIQQRCEGRIWRCFRFSFWHRSFRSPHKSETLPRVRSCTWALPWFQEVKINVGAVAIGSPGSAGIGAVARNNQGDVIGPKSQVDRKYSLLDEDVEEEVKLEFVIEGLGLSINKWVGSKSKKVQKSQSTRLMAGVDDGKKKGTGGEGRTNLPKTSRIDSSVHPESIALSKLARTFPKK